MSGGTGILSDLAAFVALGFRHIVDVQAMDHVLFLVALAAIYRPRDWRAVLWVVTAFTVGHSASLALAVTDALVVPPRVIEFLIPLTIVAAAVENLVVRERDRRGWRTRYRPLLAGVFGLVHGAGFAEYLRSLFLDRIALPLLGFNVGIELGQLVVLAAAAVALLALDRAIAWAIAWALARPLPLARAWRPSPLGVRIVLVSSGVALAAGRWAVERAPW